MYYVGIDVSKNKLDVLWLRDITALKVKTKIFKNSHSDWTALNAWLLKQTGGQPEQIHVVMEATSVYHESLAYALHGAGMQVYVANPLRVKDFARSEGQRNKTDQRDALTLALFVAQKQPRLIAWRPEAPEVRHLRALITRIDALEKDLQRESNRQEKSLANDTTPVVLASIEAIIAALKAEIKRLQKDVDDHINRHPKLKSDRALLESIPGIAAVTSLQLLTVLHSKTFHSARQLAAYLGLTPAQYSSGSSIHKPSRIGKAGSGTVRHKLYMAAITAATYNPDVHALKQRLQAKGKSGKAIIIAAMRRLVHIAFGVIKHQSTYTPQTS